MKVIYEASCNSDSIEGRGYKVTIGYFEDEADAKHAVEGLGPMGMSDGDVYECVLFKSFKEFEEWKNGETRRKALAKLTREERVALGLE